MRRERGFTLVEVLVALGIVAIALVAGLQASAALIRNAQRQSDMLLAQLCAENELTRVRLARQMPGVGESSGTCTSACRSAFHCARPTCSDSTASARSCVRVCARTMPSSPCHPSIAISDITNSATISSMSVKPR